MSKHFVPARPRGLIGAARADGASAAEIFAELRRTIEAEQQKNDERLQGIENRFDDVITQEELERISNEVTTLTNALNDANAAIAALNVGGGGDAPNPHAAEHAQAFERFFRRGVDNDLSDLEVKAQLTTQSDPDGGYLVPTETEQTIDRVLGVVSVMRQLCTVMPIGTDQYKKLVNVGGADAGWVGEEDDRPETQTSSLREIIINTEELYANPATTQKMLDDGIIDIAAWLADEVQIAFAEQEGEAFLTGNGKNKPRGLLDYPTVSNDNHQWGKIGFIKSGAAAGFMAPSASESPHDPFLDLYYALKQGYRQNAAWLMSDATMGMVRKFKDTDGRYIYRGPDSSAEVGTVHNKPVYTDDFMPKVAANKFAVAFGDFKRSYLIADRVGIRVLRDPFTNKPRVHFYTTKRVGGGLVNFESMKLLKIAA